MCRLHQYQRQDATRVANEAMGAALVTQDPNLLFFPDDQCRDNEWFQLPPIFLSHDEAFWILDRWGTKQDEATTIFVALEEVVRMEQMFLSVMDNRLLQDWTG